MKRRHLIWTLVCLTTGVALATDATPGGDLPTPNVIIMVADDLGYGDLGCFGNTTLRTPHLDLLATQGATLTHTITADTVCTPSRAALLTGRYPVRSGMAAPHMLRVLLFTTGTAGLPAEEVTFAELAKAAGYSTAFLGKWHVGWNTDPTDPSSPHPLNQGFDYFYGLPLTNLPDFGDHNVFIFRLFLPNLLAVLTTTFCTTTLTLLCLVRTGFIRLWLAILCAGVVGVLCGGAWWVTGNMKLLNSFLYRNYENVEQPVHLPTVTRKLVLEAERFLAARQTDGRPFLLVLSWLHVHMALVTGPEFKGRSRHGPYGDAVEEMDWGVGRVMAALQSRDLENDTLVFFTSDNGAACEYDDIFGRRVGGHNGPFRGSKGDASSEGAFRVPGIARWPGQIAAGRVVSEPVSLLDVLPTLAGAMRVPLPADRAIDGKDVLPLLRGQVTVSPHRFLFHYCHDQVHAVRYRPLTGATVWKLTFRDPGLPLKFAVTACANATVLDPPHLFDVTSDPGETVPLDLDRHAEVVAAMMSALTDHTRSVQPAPSQFTAAALIWRPWKQPCCQFPQCRCKDEQFQGLFEDE